jgi:hypothetical protein
MALVGTYSFWSACTRQNLLGQTYGVSMDGFSIDALMSAPAVRFESLMLVRLLL